MPASKPSLIERGDETQRLDQVLERAEAGTGGGVRILGPAGVGKTSLVRQAVGLAHARGIEVWSVTAGQLDGNVAYGVVRRLFDARVRGLSAADRRRLNATPARLSLSRLWGVATSLETETASQGDIAHSLSWLLEDLTAADPLMLIVDDAQWADEESLLFLESMSQRLADQPLIIVVAARDETQGRSPALAALVADRDAHVLRLDALSEEGTRVLLEERWGRCTAALAEAVSEVTGGNPFLVLALAGALDGAAEDLTPAAVRSAVPATVIDLVIARLSRCSPIERTLAEAVAVLTSSSTTMAAAVTGLSLPEITAAADRLRDDGLLENAADLRYRHALLRSAAYAWVGPSRRDELHRTAAHLLAAEGAEDAAAAHLLAAAGTADPWAVGVLRRTAGQAVAKGAPHTAVTLLQRAVAEPPVSEDLAEVLHELARAQMRAYDPECVATMSKVIEVAREPALRVASSYDLAQAFSFAGFYALAAQTLSKAAEWIVPADQTALDARWVAAGLMVPDLVARARLLAASYDGVLGDGDVDQLMVLQQLAIAAGTNQPAGVIRDFARRALTSEGGSRQSVETTEWAWPRLFLAMIGDYDEVREMADDGLAEATAQGSVLGLVTAGFIRAFTDLHSGRLLDAEDHYRAMLEHGASLGGGLQVETLGYGGLAQTLAMQGRTAQASDLLEMFPDTLPPEAPANGAASVYFARSLTRQLLGDHHGALAAAEQVKALVTELDVDSPTWASWRVLAIEPLRSLERWDEARHLAAEHLALCERSEVPHLIGEALYLAASVTADQTQVVDLLQRSVDVLAVSSSRWRYGTACLRLGATLRRAGRKADAREPLLKALSTFVECGAATSAEEARAELAASGVRQRTEAGALTPSEQRIAALAAEGLGNRDIALRLHITRKTVETHLSSVYRKLDIAGRDELGAALGPVAAARFDPSGTPR